MKSSYGPAPTVFPLALTIPVVTVLLKPKGLPIAITQSPTRSTSELPKVTAGKESFVSILMTAKSVFGSSPRIFALVLLFVAQRHGDLLSIVHDVVVGQDQAVFANDES